MDFSDLSIKHMDFTNEEWGMGMPGMVYTPKVPIVIGNMMLNHRIGGTYHTFRRTAVQGGFSMPNLFWDKTIAKIEEHNPNLELIADF